MTSNDCQVTHLLEKVILLIWYVTTVDKRDIVNEIVGQCQRPVCVVNFVTKTDIVPKTVAYHNRRETLEARWMQVAITEMNKRAKRNPPSTRCTKLPVNSVDRVNSESDNNIFFKDSVSKCSHFLYLQIQFNCSISTFGHR